MAAASCTAQQFQFNPQKQMPSTHTSFHSRYACALNCHYCARLSLRCSKRLHLAIACAANTKSRKRLKNSPPSPSIMTSPKKVLVPIGLGTEEAEAVIMTDVLRRAGAQVTMASVEPQLEIQGCNGLKIVADDYIASCEDNIFDLVLLPGGMPGAARLRDSEILQKITKRQAQKNRLHGAISEASALVLDAWGLLMGIEVACHPQFTYRTSALWIVNKNVHKDGMLITARGPGNATDLALAFVEQLFGKERCEEVRKDLVMPALLERESKVEEFNAVEWISSNRPRVLVPIANGSDEMEVAVIVDVLRRANAEVVLASIEGRLEIVGLEKVKLVADMLMEDAAISLYDLIVLPVSMFTGRDAWSRKIERQQSFDRIVEKSYNCRQVLWSNKCIPYSCPRNSRTVVG
eukprot:TRINITY_DN2327_c0_g1_i2.p1 TRINITY_DN2327_c0_g1~~TRINITY_DN2327_c0_g1_i2.p1  ORF type:complete len:406 (+),score=88.05 TRINITY_DN2327_c0_g1_i2:175-1392(+)